MSVGRWMQIGVRLACAGCVMAAPPAAAQTTSTTAAGAFSLRTSIKSTALVSRAPHDRILFPERTGASSLWRIRVEPGLRVGTRASATLAYEQRLRVSSQSSGLAGERVLPSEAAAAYRARPLDWRISSASSGYSWRHELDRANVVVDAGRVDVTIGRQAIGWGRGVLFGAVDLFAPFSPVEADREWRRGVDGVRAKVALSDDASLDLLSVFGTSLDTSAFAAAARRTVAGADIEIAGGRRAEDLFAGVSGSRAVGRAALHGEAAVFRAPRDRASDGTVVKAVIGGSHQFPAGNGVLVYAEYHFSGYGAARAEDILVRLADPRFLTRYLRGDTQILRRHALATLASYEISPSIALAAQWLLSPVDGSGVVAPSVTLTLGDQVSIIASSYLSYGRPPEQGTLRSEYGTMPRSLVLQLRIHM